MDKKMVKEPKFTSTKVQFIKEFLKMVRKLGNSLYPNPTNNILESWKRVYTMEMANLQLNNQHMKEHFIREKSMDLEKKFFLLLG